MKPEHVLDMLEVALRQMFGSGEGATQTVALLIVGREGGHILVTVTSAEVIPA